MSFLNVLILNCHPKAEVSNQECYCPSETRRSHHDDCDHHHKSHFLHLLTSIFHHKWELIKLIFTKLLPFVIPILALKTIVASMSILKFVSLLKILMFLRMKPGKKLKKLFFPKLKIKKLKPKGSTIRDVAYEPVPHPYEPVHPHELLVEEGRENANDNYVEATWDLAACPNRMACEVGVYLAKSSYAELPQNLVNYLTNRVDWVERKSDGDGDGDGEGGDGANQMQRYEAYKTFFIAFGNKWTQNKCVMYKCAVLFS